MSIETRGVLAGRYTHHAGRGGEEQVYLTHSLDTVSNETLCRRIPYPADAYLADEYADDIGAAPRCPLCLKRDARFGGTFKPRARKLTPWTDAMEAAEMEKLRAASSHKQRVAIKARIALGRRKAGLE